ncbi:MULTISPECIES: adenylosuccinate lyase [unclassified Fusibacter]|uniref:adenylosuccinate lyase n=1 Tax=unclassified Fusibacter TaxID=2624464 RepID=UPI001010DB49|nr:MULTISPECIES: adenylosuccinate lyase [unclassified Fusibacter]MCK8058853.1 adenylosuccinate lyase [Fusibacter sp. A2]NPE21927.1 adenylosuccinate lyase [Fusibacter sp. A1]RXV61497.1 adenylosuccinate lyase [Fusibacter sp. A1]
MTDKYNNPLITRYASVEMQNLFSDDVKFSTWRKCWIALAEAEKELGLDIKDEQIEEMKKHVTDINYDRARAIEKETRHDVMSHVHAFGEQCPKAMPIIHLGATSAFVGGNTDMLVMYQGLNMLKKKLATLIANFSAFADEHKSLPTLGYTHFQPAQPTTVGKRAVLWMQDLVLDYNDLNYLIETHYLRGAKGTTGTQASYLNLFEGDHDKVQQLDQLVCEKLGLKNPIPVTGQTYSRKLDSRILNVLSGIAQSMHKITNDLRLLQNMKEVEEPFEKKQIGSSAMAYKRNPMRSERIASLSRIVMANAMNPVMTVSTQWFERTLDDSANRRISLPETFLAVDAILDIGINVSNGLVVYPKVIRKNLMSELPFMATENIIMACVKNGGDRQELHEAIRVHSMAAAKVVKEEGGQNDLLHRIVADELFGLNEADIEALMEPSQYVGRSPEQVDWFNETIVKPILDEFEGDLAGNVDLKV